MQEQVIFEGERFDVLDTAYLVPETINSGEEVFSTRKYGILCYMIWYVDQKRWLEHTECERVTNDDTFFQQDTRSPHLEDLGYAMVGWLDGLDDRPDNSKLPAVVTTLMAIQYDKEGSYGSSWKGKGEYRGIMANIDRKYDRLDKMTQDEITGVIKSLKQLEEEFTQGVLDILSVGESKIDAIADLANYCLLYMTYVKDNFPNLYNIWVNKNVPEYLRDKIPFLQKGTDQI